MISTVTEKKRISIFKQSFSSFLYKYIYGKGIWQLYLFALIPVSFVIIFYYLPMGGILMAFEDFSSRKGIFGSPWVGLKYFEQLFDAPIFLDILKNTVMISVFSIAVGFPFPIILALVFNELPSQNLKKALQTITFAPFFISTVVVVGILMQIFSYRFGVINELIKLLGGKAVDFLGSSSFFLPAYVFSGIWQVAGYSSILYIAALSSIDISLYEAAFIDGANRLQKIWYIDLAGIMPTIIIMLILTAGRILNVGFEKVFLMQNPVNYGSSEIIATFVYKSGVQQAQFSFAAAVGLFNSIVNCIILVLVNRLASRVSETSLF